MRSAAEARAEVDAQVDAGFHFIKVYEGLAPEVYGALLDRCRERGVRAIGHAPDGVDPERLLDGQAAVHHAGSLAWGFYWPDLDLEGVQPLAESFARGGTAFCPTLGLYRTMARQVSDLERLLARPEMAYVPAQTQSWWTAATPAVDRDRRLFGFWGGRVVRTMKSAGVVILVGTDHPNPFVVPGFSIHDELAALVDAGLTPYEALEGATRQAAEFLDSDFGTIAVGKRADLILLADNPLEDLRHLRQPLGVMSGGTWHPAAELGSLLDGVASWVAGQAAARGGE